MAVRYGLAALMVVFGLPGSATAQRAPLGYAIDVNDRSDDTFRVTAWVSGLTEANAVYQFAATAPGTYQVMDIGRYVRRFEAFDAAGRAVPVERVAVNQWKLSDAPARAHPSLHHRGDLGHAGGRAPGLPHVRHVASSRTTF